MIDLKKFKGIFISEVEDQLEILNREFLLVEKNLADGIDVNLFNNLMRASHTIKGSSASMEYKNTAFLAHVMEDIFDGARNKRLVLSNEVANLVFRAIDAIQKSLDSIRDTDIEIDTSEIANELKKAAGVKTVGTGKSNQPESAELAIGANPEKESVKPAAAEKKSEDDVLESAKAKIDYIKVPVKRLDALLDLVEELLVDKMRLSEISHRDSALKEVVDHFDLLISGIQHEVMQARLVPVEQAFARFPRMVRDLADRQKKQINFEISGGEIELDRTVVDRLGEPLIHLLRNAADHGIKDKGTIFLRAIRRSEKVLFEVENDGHGIDIEAVKAVALKKSLIEAREAANLKEKDIVDLIFSSNFSTSEKVTEISGRGVGLSVVKQFVESFGGKVLVENYFDRVKFILELPLTLAIIETLLVKVGLSFFAIPFANIERSVSVSPEGIKKMTDYDMAVIDGLNIPLISLRQIFGIEAKAEKKNIIVVLVRKDQETVGIVVDGLVSEQEVIVKPFSPVLRGIKGFSGSTILGDGSVVLILDVLNLLRYHGRV